MQEYIFGAMVVAVIISFALLVYAAACANAKQERKILVKELGGTWEVYSERTKMSSFPFAKYFPELSTGVALLAACATIGGKKMWLIDDIITLHPSLEQQCTIHIVKFKTKQFANATLTNLESSGRSFSDKSNCQVKVPQGWNLRFDELATKTLDHQPSVFETEKLLVSLCRHSKRLLALSTNSQFVVFYVQSTEDDLSRFPSTIHSTSKIVARIQSSKLCSAKLH